MPVLVGTVTEPVAANTDVGEEFQKYGKPALNVSVISPDTFRPTDAGAIGACARTVPGLWMVCGETTPVLFADDIQIPPARGMV